MPCHNDRFQSPCTVLRREVNHQSSCFTDYSGLTGYSQEYSPKSLANDPPKAGWDRQRVVASNNHMS